MCDWLINNGEEKSTSQHNWCSCHCEIVLNPFVTNIVIGQHPVWMMSFVSRSRSTGDFLNHSSFHLFILWIYTLFIEVSFPWARVTGNGPLRGEKSVCACMADVIVHIILYILCTLLSSLCTLCYHGMCLNSYWSM